ncbi:agrin-like isoform X2 [Phlebotomus papatasi]|uniref:agrin-like isoform X2 n=1 Tax=Phlebotomus papatasi TaxID=29031 RepID=UPI0024838BCB|nr:agrin-like isoform X2 [Phlebotomus papatasi]
MRVFVCFFVIFVAFCLGETASKKCNTMCPAIHSPVCCTYPDGSTESYSNSCVASVDNCQRGTSCDTVEPGNCPATEPQCGEICTYEYKPVCCTYLDGSTVTYSNSCEASVDSCKRGTSCTTLEDGECPTAGTECNDACPFNYEPVCCTYPDGSTVTYGNSCEASVDSCKRGTSCTIVEEGECSTTEPQCNDVCPFNYEPVCCTYADGSTKTYGNDCTASVDNCQRGTSCETMVPGECTTEAEPEDPAMCPQIACTEQYDPICCYYADGTTRTFGNSCEASVTNCQEKKSCTSTTSGECESTA